VPGYGCLLPMEGYGGERENSRRLNREGLSTVAVARRRTGS
jgi:hypothetical protein